MSQRCAPKGGLKCWQYKPEQPEIPAWVVTWVNRQRDGKYEFCDADGSTGVILDPNDWIVLFEEDVGAVAVYSDEEFRGQFEVMP